MICVGGIAGDIDNLAAHCFYKRRIFSFGVDDYNVCIAGEHLIDNLSLCRKGLTAARYAQDKLIAVEKLLAVGNNHILADYILPIIKTTR